MGLLKCIAKCVLYLRVSVHLTRAGEENTRVGALGQAEHVDRAEHGSFCGLNWIELVMDRRGRAGQIVDFIDLDIQWKDNVVEHKLKLRVVKQVKDVAFTAPAPLAGGPFVTAPGSGATDTREPRSRS